MSEELIKSVQEMLKQESWTRAAINDYSKNNFVDLAKIVEKAREENCTAEIKALCNEHLSHSKESIIALYVSGILSLNDGSLDNSSLSSLISFFQEYKKPEIVIYLAQAILNEDENNKLAIRTLADTYREEGKDENSAEMWALYEKLVKLDFQEADLAKLLADHFKDVDAQKSIDYYKTALLRFVNAQNITAAQEIWKKLLELIPEEIDFFLLVQRKIAKTISEDKSILLLQELYETYKKMASEKESLWNTCIEIIKLILQIDPKSIWGRREIVECYRGRYKDHSQLEDYIYSSDLTQSFRSVFEAINDFEKHIAFDKDNYVYHRSWGVGKIRKVENDNLTIRFGNGLHKMSLKMAINALTPLASDHIWVTKATTKNPQEIAEKISTDEGKVEILKQIIRSFNNSCDLKRIKAELVPSILKTSQWTSWSSKAKDILETRPEFGVNPNDINQYIVREREISKEEKYFNEFKAQKLFFSRIDIIMKFVNDEPASANEKAANIESEFFADMYTYFTGFLKTVTSVSDQVMGAYLTVKAIGEKYPALAFKCQYSFAQLYSDIDDPCKLYLELKDTKATNLRNDFLKNIKLLPDWTTEYIRLFPTVLKKEMITQLEEAGAQEKLKAFTQAAFNDIKTYREAVLYMFENCQDYDWYKNSGVSYEKQLIALLNIIELANREIENHVNSTENKKLIKQASILLFKNENLANYIFSKDEETVTKMYTLVDDISGLDSDDKKKLRNKIIEKYPDHKFHTTEEKKVTSSGMTVTARKLEEKKAQVEKLEKVDLPAIAAEIGEARAQGDLKENAEYIAAKEAQRNMSSTLKKLQEEISRAVIFDPTTVTTAFVSFGTKVTLLNKLSNEKDVYTILGPWESDPDNKIISYLSPLGDALLDAKAGDDISFTINMKEYSFHVEAIELADL